MTTHHSLTATLPGQQLQVATTTTKSTHLQHQHQLGVVLLDAFQELAPANGKRLAMVSNTHAHDN